MTIILRPNQEAILKYTHGWMGVAAVPGSGKTWTLALLAAHLLAEVGLRPDQEVLVVTLANSAVDNFDRSIRLHLEGMASDEGPVPRAGYRVRTLHGLAHDIVRERPGLVGLPEDFQILDDREAEGIRSEAARDWLDRHPEAADLWLHPDLDEARREWVVQDRLPELVEDLAVSFIRTAKDLALTPEEIRTRLDELPFPLSLAEMGAEIYAQYQRALAYRAGVDFDDLIRLALLALERDPAYRERLRDRWPYILEDEAQDSSRLQEEILQRLAGPEGNWVRMGDPNQAIYETFTTASPRFLRAFLARPDVTPRSLPHSGRATQSLIDLGNYLVEWVQGQHPVEAARDALQGPPWIIATPEGDPQPNPPDDPGGVHLVGKRFTPEEEIAAVADSLEQWLPEHPDSTVVVLSPRNVRGFDLVDELRSRKIEWVDGLLRSSSSTRFSAGALANLLHYLADPASARALATAYRVWRRGDRQDEAAQERMDAIAARLRGLVRVEDYLWPEPGHDWLEASGLEDQDPAGYQQLGEFRELTRRWQGAALLPVDQLTQALAQDLLSEAAELALAFKLAGLLRRAQRANPDWRLPEFTEELATIARNERRYLGFSDEDLGFDPEKYKGKVVVSTLHKAKGLEWDRVYLMSANSYDFPSGLHGEGYFAEKWFIRGNLNLEAEALAQLRTALDPEGQAYTEGAPTLRTRLDYVRERLRLFYVGITRARRELIVTYNTGRRGDQAAALPFQAMYTYWKGRVVD